MDNHDHNAFRDLPIEPELDSGGEAGSSPAVAVTPQAIALMAAGGVLGTLLRVGFAELMTSPVAGFPWATFIVNVVGAFILGATVVYVARSNGRSRYIQPLVATGICGSLTTFSTMIWQADNLARLHHLGVAMLYLAVSLFAGLGAVVVGMWVMRQAPGHPELVGS